MILCRVSDAAILAFIKMAKKESEPAPLPSYRNPPVNEVVCGARFAALERFMVPHIGLFWDSVRKDFPNCEHAAPLSVDLSVLDAATGLPIPRIWLINRSEDRLIQLQKDVFFYNWRSNGSSSAATSRATSCNIFRVFLGSARAINPSKLGTPSRSRPA